MLVCKGKQCRSLGRGEMKVANWTLNTDQSGERKREWWGKKKVGTSKQGQRVRLRLGRGACSGDLKGGIADGR